MPKHQVEEDVALPSNLPRNPKYDDLNPALLTRQEYLDAINPSGRYHDGDAYSTTVAKMNSSEYLSKENFPKLLRQMIVNGIQFEVRMGQPHDDEIVAIYNEDDQCVAALQDEWGCVLIWVAKEYQGFNFGILLGKIARTMFPGKPSGGFTQAGERNFINAHRELVRDALTSGFYRTMIRSGKLTIERVQEIISSLGLKKKPKKQDQNLSSNKASDWLLYGDFGGFVLYDRKLKDIDYSYEERIHHFAEKMIKAYVLVRFPHENADWGILVQFGADSDKLKGFMLNLAAAYCEKEGGYLYIDEKDLPFVDHSILSIGDLDLKSGYKRAPAHLKTAFSYDHFLMQEQIWRRSFDRYGEFHQRIIEMAEAKYQQVPKRNRWGREE